MNNMRGKWQDNDQGFSLVEILVALVIFALGVMAFLQSQKAALQNLIAIDQYQFAGIIAENQMVLIMAQDFVPVEGVKTGKASIAGHSFIWKRRISKLAANDLMQVVVSVHDVGDEQELSRLTAYKGLLL